MLQHSHTLEKLSAGVGGLGRGNHHCSEEEAPPAEAGGGGAAAVGICPAAVPSASSGNGAGIRGRQLVDRSREGHQDILGYGAHLILFILRLPSSLSAVLSLPLPLKLPVASRNVVHQFFWRLDFG